MTRNPNIAIATIGGQHFALPDPQSALELMAIMSKAVHIDDYLYPVREYTNCSHCLAPDQELPELKFITLNKLNGMETREEIKARGDREKKDREDMEQAMRPVEEPVALPAPDHTDPF